ncbi:hypothetical protein FQA39_LY17856 [Lamprigera yunnana]|nr:hypothetical protein FQA39_LY17856 [Lamprigera yunnana]
MSWSRKEVICLIEEYRKWPNLYKVKSVNYKNRNLRKTALESIENSLKKSKPNITSTEIQNKFQSLKQNALKKYKKWKNSYKSGTGEDKVYEPSLWYFQIISFVIADNVPRESQDTLDGTENTETQIQEFDSVMDPSINEHESEYEEVYSEILGENKRWRLETDVVQHIETAIPSTSYHPAEVEIEYKSDDPRFSTPKKEHLPIVSTPQVATPHRAKKALFHAKYVQCQQRRKIKLII